MKRKKVNPFFLIVKDDDNLTFAVEGPMIDDGPWNHAVVAAQETGRNIRCTTSAVSESKEAVAAQWRQHYDHKLVPSGTIVHPTSF